MPSPPVAPPFLGELETAVMEFFWSAGQAEVKAVHEAVGEPRGVTLNTTQSTVRRLFDKGLLGREKVSHAYVYNARVTRTDVGRRLLGQLARQLRSTRQGGLLFAFSDLTEDADERTLVELERLVARRRQELARRR